MKCMPLIESKCDFKVHLLWNSTFLIACDFLLIITLELAPPEIAEFEEVFKALPDLSSFEYLSCIEIT